MKTEYPKLICLQDILTEKEFKQFSAMLEKDWPQVYEAWMKNTEALAKFNSLVGEK
jgi:hypothetical protein